MVNPVSVWVTLEYQGGNVVSGAVVNDAGFESAWQLPQAAAAPALADVK